MSFEPQFICSNCVFKSCFRLRKLCFKSSLVCLACPETILSKLFKTKALNSKSICPIAPSILTTQAKRRPPNNIESPKINESAWLNLKIIKLPDIKTAETAIIQEKINKATVVGILFVFIIIHLLSYLSVSFAEISINLTISG